MLKIKDCTEQESAIVAASDIDDLYRGGPGDITILTSKGEFFVAGLRATPISVDRTAYWCCKTMDELGLSSDQQQIIKDNETLHVSDKQALGLFVHGTKKDRSKIGEYEQLSNWGMCFATGLLLASARISDEAQALLEAALKYEEIANDGAIDIDNPLWQDAKVCLYHAVQAYRATLTPSLDLDELERLQSEVERTKTELADYVCKRGHIMSIEAQFANSYRKAKEALYLATSVKPAGSRKAAIRQAESMVLETAGKLVYSCRSTDYFYKYYAELKADWIALECARGTVMEAAQ